VEASLTPESGRRRRGAGGDWAEEFAPATVAERSWLFEAGSARSAGDEPSGADLLEDVRPAPVGVAAGLGRGQGGGGRY
jgi:hypothetical protein